MAHTVPNPTREEVLATLAECDRLGVDAFLKLHGYRPSTKFVLRHNSRSYPSKAILGVAAGLKSNEFSGGAAHTCRVLKRLGFEVRTGKMRGLNALLVLLAMTVPFDPPATPPELPVEPVAYFASGSNHAGEIAAFADMGHDVGVAVRRVGPNAMRALLALEGTDVQVFADSGVFSERDRKTFQIVAPITERVWDRILGAYDTLSVLGSQLNVVAPDRVADQDYTLGLLTKYADRMRALHAKGVTVLLPVQKGARTQAAFYREACAILGFEAVPALPCKKAATTIAEARAFAAEIRPARVHLLGMGTRNALAPAFMRALVEAAPGIAVQLDSVVIASLSGRANGPGGTPRAITKAYDAVEELAVREPDALPTATERKYLGLVLALGAAGTVRTAPSGASMAVDAAEATTPTTGRLITDDAVQLALLSSDATVTTFQILATQQGA